MQHRKSECLFRFSIPNCRSRTGNCRRALAIPDSPFPIPVFQCVNAVSKRASRPRTEPSITRSPASMIAPPITPGSTRCSSSISRPKRFLSATLIAFACASGTGVAERSVTLRMRSASRLSSSNNAAMSGSRDARRFSTSNVTKPPNDESAVSPGGSSKPTSSALPSFGLPINDAMRASAAICAATRRFCAHAASAPAFVAASNAARAYGRARVRVSLISDLAYELIEQRLVGVCVDLALDDLLRALHGERGDLAAQRFARLADHAFDLGLRDRLLPRGFEQRVGLGLVEDLVGLGLRLLDDLARLRARLLDFLGDARVGILELGFRALRRGQAVGDALGAVVHRFRDRRPDELHREPDQYSKYDDLGDERCVDAHGLALESNRYDAQ